MVPRLRELAPAARGGTEEGFTQPRDNSAPELLKVTAMERGGLSAADSSSCGQFREDILQEDELNK